MSAFLGPIHFWLFNKIKIHESLEREIEKAFTDKYGSDVSDIVAANIAEYGERLVSDQLDELIDESNIHGWLQRSIAVVETRQAALLARLFDKYGCEAVSLAKDVFKANGSQFGIKASEDMVVTSPEDVYKSINNYVLDGMPCDAAANVIHSDSDKLVAKQEKCLHIDYWNKAGVDTDLMYELRTEWIKSFVSSLSSDFEYDMTREGQSRDTSSCTIVRK